jgi:hypothetical protein
VVTTTASDGKESTDMSAQQQMLWPNDIGRFFSSALVVLMAILAMLGVIAHAAAA